MTHQLIWGLVTGILFGFFLQRGQVLRYDKQIGALRLIDMTILKFMLTAIFVGSVGIYLLKDLGLVTLSIKSTVLGATIIGGCPLLLFDPAFHRCPLQVWVSPVRGPRGMLRQSKLLLRTSASS